MIIDSNIQFEGIVDNALALHLGEYMTLEEITEECFEEIVYIKNEKVKAKKGEKNIKVGKNAEEKHQEKFQKLIEEPNDKE